MDILYLDERVIVCIKPAGVLSTDEPGGMPSLLRQYLEDASACVRTVHRLDRPASGVMVYARSRMADSILSRQVQEHTFKKEYLAVLSGIPAEPEGTLSDLLFRERQTQRTIVVSEPGKNVQPAELHYRVLACSGGRSLVRIQLKTGRTHQIRAQFSSRRLPLVGDRKYGFAGQETELALWSCRVCFLHPQTNEPMTFFRLPPSCGPWAAFPCLQESSRA